VQRDLRVQIKQKSLMNLDDGEKQEKKLDNWFADREFILAAPDDHGQSGVSTPIQMKI
jgi:hypothetical protein